MNKCLRFICPVLFILISSALTTLARQSAVRDTYVKHEYRIPMRDGVKLFTAVYVPRDTSRPYPILLSRTPYSCSPYGEENYPRVLRPVELSAAGYVFAYQDVRGR